MYDLVSSFIEHSIEFRSFGLNWQTLVFLLIFLLTVYQGLRTVGQLKQIRTEKHGRSVPIESFIYGLFSSTTFLIYGISIASLCTIYSSLQLLIISAFILASYWFYEGVRWWHIALIVVLLPLPIRMIFLYSDSARLAHLSIVLIGTSCFLLLYPLLLIKNSSTGALNGKFLTMMTSIYVFWFLYWLWVGATPLVIFNAFAAIVMLSSVILYRYYKMKEKVLSTVKVIEK